MSVCSTIARSSGWRGVGKCVLTCVLILVFSAASFAQAQIKMRPAQTPEQKREQKIQQWKQALITKGVGEKSKWEVKLLDGRKIKGYLSEIREDGFTLVDIKTEDSSRIAFSDLRGVKHRGMPAYAKAGIAGVAVFGALIVPALIAASKE